MSKIEVNTIDTQCGSALQIGDGNTATIGLGKSGDTITVPCGATIVNSGTATGFGRTGTVDWNTTKITADPANAVSGTGYFCDTSGGAFTVTLPTSPSAGDIVAVSDYTRTFNSNNLTIGRNSKPIGGVAADGELTVDGQSATFVFVDDTEGWINTQETQTSQTGLLPFVKASGGNQSPACGIVSGDYKYHTFTGPGTLCVSAAGTPGGSNKLQYLVVAGGGSGAGNATPVGRHGAGGGAGGYRYCETGLCAVAQGYPIVVGGGGAGASYPAVNGNDSSFSTITSTGGGIGGGWDCGSKAGGPGGSGGGTGRSMPVSCVGTGNTPVVSPPQGNDGSAATPPAGNPQTNGAGGGAGAAAVPKNGAVAAPGGDGQNNLSAWATATSTGDSGYYAGGGGGGAHGTPGSPAYFGAGGAGGGGAGGAANGNNPGTAGSVNTGGGGGGAATNGCACGACGGAGGSGIVIIKYKFQ